MNDHTKPSINQELNSAVNVLDQAIRMHSEWLTRLHEHLICREPVTDDILNEDAHRLCALGNWYYHDAPALLQEYDEFNNIEEVHRLMHQQARQIAFMHINDKGISKTEYHQFINSQRSLMYLLSRLKEKILLSAHSFDELTGAVGREAFQLLAVKNHAEAERQQELYCVAMIDLDHFKNVNDQYGHLFGDKVLREVSHSILRHTRKTDTVCRFGGEEFLLLLPHTRLADACDILDKIRLLIETLVISGEGEQSVSVTISAGIAEWQPGLAFEQLVERADQALYKAKGEGRNRVSVWQ